MKLVKFVPNYKPLFNAGVSGELLRGIPDESLLHACSIDHSIAHGGPITQQIILALEQNEAFLSKLKPSHYHWAISVKSVLLQCGQYFDMPGWKCDGVKNDPSTGEPDLDSLDISIPHYTCMLSVPQQVASMEFFTEAHSIMIDGDRVWDSVNRYLEYFGEKLNFEGMTDGEVYVHTQSTIRRVTAAVEKGWVYIFRCAATPDKPLNQIKKSAQIYTPVWER